MCVIYDDAAKKAARAREAPSPISCTRSAGSAATTLCARGRRTTRNTRPGPSHSLISSVMLRKIPRASGKDCGDREVVDGAVDHQEATPRVEGQRPAVCERPSTTSTSAAHARALIACAISFAEWIGSTTSRSPKISTAIPPETPTRAKAARRHPRTQHRVASPQPTSRTTRAPAGGRRGRGLTNGRGSPGRADAIVRVELGQPVQRLPA